MIHTDTHTFRTRRALLDAALPDILFDGWTNDTLRRAAHSLNIDDTTLRAAFPKGITDALDTFAAMADIAMHDTLSTTDPHTLPTRDRIATAIMARFDALCPHKDAVRTSLKCWLNPLRKPRAARILWRTADHIWTWAGDTATDYNRYTKRALLTPVLTAATLVWLNDHTPNHEKTNRFVRARLDTIVHAGQALRTLNPKRFCSQG